MEMTGGEGKISEKVTVLTDSTASLPEAIPANLHIRTVAYYVHAGAQREAEKIKALVETKLEVVEALFAELSPARAVHSGPGTAGLCYDPGES